MTVSGKKDPLVNIAGYICSPKKPTKASSRVILFEGSSLRGPCRRDLEALAQGLREMR